MYKILHFLFGWHYVWVRDCGSSHICRVTKLPSGELMGSILLRDFFIKPDGTIRGAYNIQDWRPLTWNAKMEKSDEH